MEKVKEKNEIENRRGTEVCVATKFFFRFFVFFSLRILSAEQIESNGVEKTKWFSKS